MNIIILGAGAIGSLFGAVLSKQNNVLLIGKKDHVDCINKYGLKVKEVDEKVYKIKATEHIEEIPSNTLLIVTTKAFDIEKSLAEIKDKIQEDTIILCLQNGLRIKEIAEKALDNKHEVIRGITYIGALFTAPGEIHGNTRYKTVIKDTKQSKKVAEVLNNAEIQTEISDNILKEIWKKVVVNCVINPLCSILECRNCDLHDKLEAKKEMIIEECIAVAKAEGIELDKEKARKAIDYITANSSNIPSMAQDLMKKGKTEIDFLNGAVVRIAKKYNINTPVNDGVTHVIKNMERR